MDDLKPFEAFMLAYQDMVFGTALRLLGDPTEAEDVAQEVFLKAYERFAEMKDSPTVGGWLKTVARNLSLNHLTRHRARWTHFSDLAPSDDPDRDMVAELAAPDVSDSRWEQEEQASWLELGLQKLPPSQRIPLVLYHFEEMSYEEIASRLAVSLSKVKTDIHRGREALRRHLERAGYSPEMSQPKGSGSHESS